MHTLAAAVLQPLARDYGTPQVVEWEVPVLADELNMVRNSQRGWRSHDVTFFIFDPAGQVVVIRKPVFPPGVWRAPSGGIEPGEDFVAGTVREAWEETGLPIRLEQYVLRIHARFETADGAAAIPWITHIFTATAAQTALDPQDLREIAAARWCTMAELTGPVRQALWKSGQGLFHYRAGLTDATAAILAGKPCPKRLPLAQ